ncbi:hypothetical protein [Rhizobium sp. MHM7A]|uniref:secretion/conjugation apparatus DotM-related subunit n=1 Tax=Rhizobium sp. MHM7A TaxID=2583233 RepID=UPI0011068429|nr:hypothetical protein [Rhizobium sp. MHM7A]TLX16718.1 hypothetical protein FFR93_05085 [Rhizobium sp. MHM7A]
MKICFDPAFSHLATHSINTDLVQPAPGNIPLDVPALVEQLEGPWTSFESLNRHRKRGIQQLWERLSGGTEQEARLAFITKSDQRINKELQQVLELLNTRHFYAATVVLGLIEAVKAKASFTSTTDFGWAKVSDPAFWHLINGHGRRTVHPSVVGAFTHYEFERKQGTAISRTDFEGATLICSDRTRSVTALTG